MPAASEQGKPQEPFTVVNIVTPYRLQPFTPIRPVSAHATGGGSETNSLTTHATR
jgi:hypothetical protein